MTHVHEDLAADPHPRLAERRNDQAWLAQRWADPSTRVLVIAGNRLRTVDSRVHWTAPDEAPDGIRVLLGERDGVALFAVLLKPDQGAEDWVGLRAVLPGLAAGELPDASEIFHAMGIAEWHHATRFCPRCGGGLAPKNAGAELGCGGCGRSQFPRTDPAVIMAITSGSPNSDDEAILLGRHPGWPEGRFSTLAGFLEPGETLEDAVRREVLEEVGVHVGEVAYFGNQPWPLPASLMLGFTGRAVSTEIVVDGTEISAARWFTRAQLLAEAEAGQLMLPSGISISRSLIESWYGAPLPGTW